MDILPKENPPGLPLMRDIQQCIDFILGPSIPNKATYWMNPKNYKELQWQVSELLEKGLIRESMSHCVVPAILVPKHGGAFRICIDCRAIKKITIKYHFPIPRLNVCYINYMTQKCSHRSIWEVEITRIECGRAISGRRLSRLVTGYTN